MKNGVNKRKGGFNCTANLRLGESLEQKLRRYKESQEPIEQIGSEIYQERSEGVDPLCDIRTDRHDLALEAYDKVTKTHIKARNGKFEDGTDAEGNKIVEKVVETPITD